MFWKGLFITTVCFTPCSVLYSAACSATWNEPGDSNWGNPASWNPCVPGVSGNTNDVATFVDLPVPTIVATLSVAGVVGEPITLFTLNFDAALTQYTIEQFSTASTITFDANPAGVPQINVDLGIHTINAPIILNQNTELFLADGVQLIFNSLTSLNSATTQNFTVAQSSPSEVGSGLFSNNTTLTPFSMSVLSAAVLNNGRITLDAEGNLNVSGGSVQNSSGAVLQAGSGGTLFITGGAITNDSSSTVGSTTANIVFTDGTLESSGNVIANDYVQGGSSALQLDLVSLPTIFGNVAASGTASVGSTLVVNALPGSVTSQQNVNLITAEQGVSGTYSLVDFLNFPAEFIPNILYRPNAVVLTLVPGLTANDMAPLSQLPLISVDETNIIIQRKIDSLHNRIISLGTKGAGKRNETGSLFLAKKVSCLHKPSCQQSLMTISYQLGTVLLKKKRPSSLKN